MSQPRVPINTTVEKTDIRTRIFGPFATAKNGGKKVEAKLDEFLERLLLFDKYIIQSQRLRDVVPLVQRFGFEAVIELLRSTSIQVHDDVITIGTPKLSKSRTALIFEFIPFGLVQNAGLDSDLLRLKVALQLNESQFKLLESLLLDVIQKYPANATEDLYSGFEADLRENVPYVKNSLLHNLRKRNLGVSEPEKLELEVAQLGKYRFKVDTNIQQLFRLTADASEHIVRHSLLSVGGINRRILEMRIYSAISGFAPSEADLFGEKLRFIEDQLSSALQVQRFHRVLEAVGLPDFRVGLESNAVDLKRLLEIRQSRETIEFRNWLWSIGTMDDKELRERITSLKSRMSQKISTGWGKRIRWIATSGIGIIPAVGNILGPISSAIDSFLLEKLFPASGVATFVNQLYPSVFRTEKQ
jgi:hypothetical protein